MNGGVGSVSGNLLQWKVDKCGGSNLGGAYLPSTSATVRAVSCMRTTKAEGGSHTRETARTVAVALMRYGPWKMDRSATHPDL